MSNFVREQEVLVQIESLRGPQGMPGAPGRSAEVDATLKTAGMAADAKATGDAMNALSQEIQKLAGTNKDAAALLIAILRGAAYDTDQSGNIDALRMALGCEEIPDAPSQPEKETLALGVVLGSVSRIDGQKLTYDTTSSSASIRASINPIAVYVQSGKTYTISLSDYSDFGISIQAMSYSGKDTDFTVTAGTQRVISGDFTRTYTSGWKHEDVCYAADGTADVLSIGFGKGAAHNETITEEDIAKLNSLLTVSVE